MKKSLCIIGLVLSLGLAGCENLGPNVSFPAPIEQDNLYIEVEGLYRSNGIVLGISGTATNYNNDLNMCMILFDILDKEGVKVSEAVALTNSLKAGMKWRFQATFTNPFSTNFSEIKLGKIQKM